MNLESIIVAALFTFVAGCLAGAKLTVMFFARFLHSEKGHEAALNYLKKHKDCPLWEGAGFSHKLSESKRKDIDGDFSNHRI